MVEGSLLTGNVVTGERTCAREGTGTTNQQSLVIQ